MAMTARVSRLGGGIIAEKRNGVRQLFRHDPLGSTIAVFSDEGKVTGSYTYWPYGEVRTSSGTAETPWKFCGYWGYYSGPTNLNYVRQRFLDTSTARWSTPDPMWPLMSTYAYCYQQPTKFVDPFGMAPWNLAFDCNADIIVGTGPILQKFKCFPNPIGIPPCICIYVPGGEHGGVYPPGSKGLPDIYWYGNYCGSENIVNEKCKSQYPPVDCMDAGCDVHDQCLTDCMKKHGSNYYFHACGAKCHCDLFKHAAYCMSGGCEFHYEPVSGIPVIGDLLGKKNCYEAAITVGFTFEAICVLTKGTGFIIGIGEGGGNGGGRKGTLPPVAGKSGPEVRFPQ